MVPIYEQGKGVGIGHSHDDFHKRFEEICAKKPNRKFAFIFYDFNDIAIRKIIKDQGVFAKLDRLSGPDLDIFYIHGKKKAIDKFNAVFAAKIGIKDLGLPCVAFFTWSEGKFTDVVAVSLEGSGLIHGFHEIFGVVQAYIQKPDELKQRNILGRVKLASQFVLQESVRDLLKALFDHLPFIHH